MSEEIQVDTQVDIPATAATQNAAVEKDDGLDHKTLFVRSIPFEATSEELMNYFSQFVPVKHAVVVTDDDQKSRGFGFVSFGMEDDTVTALVEAKKAKFKNRLLRVDIAKRRHRKEPETSTPRATIPPIEKRRARLIVRNLPWSCKKPDQLKNLFSKYGAVFDAYIPKKKNGQMLGFAFVIMKKTSAAEKAVKESVGLKIDGREVAVDLALEKSKWEEVREDEKDEEEDDEEGDDDEEEEYEKDEVDEEDDDEEDDNLDESDDDNDNDSDDDFDALNNIKEEDLEEEAPKPKQNKQEAFSVFVRNIPYDTTAEGLKEHFKVFGAVKYALPVKDRETGIARGSAFVAFFKEDAYAKCLENAPEIDSTTLLIADDVLPEYVFEGRVLNITSAVDRKSATHLTERNNNKRMEALGKEVGLKDRRNMYLLNEGRITQNSKLAQFLSKTDMEVRDKSYKLRVQQLNKNPGLHLSMTRLAIRNLPRSMTPKALKALARKGVVQFATEVKNGQRQPLSKEEVNRSIKLKQGEEELVEPLKKSKHAGVVKQAKVINEIKGSGEIGRSRGYGFVEFRDHKTALMGLRWLNAHEVVPEEILEGLDEEQKKLAELSGLSRRRLVVEFAIENAKVVKRRKDNVLQARLKDKKEGLDEKGQDRKPYDRKSHDNKHHDKRGSKRSRDDDDKRGSKKHKPNRKGNMNKGNMNKGEKEKPAEGEVSDSVKQMIGKKRKQRKNKK